jgi:hypothetical protein
MIIILGDSWGMGEWGVDPRTKETALTGPGIGQYFSLHDKVINLSEGGSTNTAQVQWLLELLAKFKPDTGDTFYWIVTDPLRCLKQNNILASKFDNVNSIEQTVRDELDLFFDQINAIGILHKITFNLIGGRCDLNDINLERFTNLKVIVPSWGQLLDSSYCTSIYCEDYLSDLGKILRKQRPNLIEEWNKISNAALEKRKSIDKLRQKGFINDQIHPNRYAHIKLRNFLAPEYSHKQ